MYLRHRRPLMLIPFALCLSIVLFFSASMTPIQASARIDPIKVTSLSVTEHFPSYIDFQMSATDGSSTITQATLSINFPTEQSPASHIVPIKKGPSISVHWKEDISGDKFRTPGTVMQYNWQIQDAAQNQHTEQGKPFKTYDTRFTWQERSQGLLQVHWYNTDPTFGQVLITRTTTALNHITQTLGAGPKRAVDIWVYTSDSAFHGALPPKVAEWVGGIAFPSLNEAFISAQNINDETLVRDLPHELTHLIFHQIVNQEDLTPLWFDEGLAVYNQFFHEPEMRDRLNQALKAHKLLPLDDITDAFPQDADQAYLAYAQSWNLLDYMYQTFGQSKMIALFRKFNDPQGNFVLDLQATLGVDEAHLENQWHLSLHQPSTLSPSQALTPTTQQAQPLLPPQAALPSTADSSQGPLTTLGIVLVILAFALILWLLIHIRQRRQSIIAVQAAERIIAERRSNTAAWQVDLHQSYMDPTAYIDPTRRPPLSQTPPPSSQPGPNQTFGTAGPGWPPNPQGAAGQQASPPPFSWNQPPGGPGSGYQNPPPRWQPPQE